MNFIFTLNEKYILQKISIFTTKWREFSSNAEKINARDAFIFLAKDHTKFPMLPPLALPYHLG